MLWENKNKCLCWQIVKSPTTSFIPSCAFFVLFNLFLLSFTDLYFFLCSPPFLSPALQPSPMVPMLPIYSGDLVFFYFPCRLDLCMSLLGSSLLSKFSGIVICGLVFFALCLKTTYEWVHVIIVFLGLGYLTQNDVFKLHPLACKFQDVIIFSSLTPHQREVWSPIYTKNTRN